MRLGEADIHAEEVASEERGLVAAGAGADFDDGALVVVGVLGQERDLEILLGLFQPLAGFRALDLGQFAHFLVQRGIGQHGVEPCDFVGHAAIHADGDHDIFHRRQFARQRHIGRAVGALGQLCADLVVTAQDDVELVAGDHEWRLVAPLEPVLPPVLTGRGRTARGSHAIGG